MSYGTILYPKIEDFLPQAKQISKDELIDSIDGETRYMANKFNEIRALAYCTPHNVFGDDAYKKVTTIVDECLSDYIESYDICSDLSNALDLKEQAENISEGETYEDGEPKRPYIYYNRFIYHSKEEAEELLKENTASLSKLKGQILGMCLATPIDITPRDQVQYSDGHEEPIVYLERELDYLEEALDDCLKTIYIAKIVAKYWDGHEEG